MKERTVKISQFLSLVLRHKPETMGLQLDEGVWLTDAVPPAYLEFPA